MVLSYSKWDAIDDSDDDGGGAAATVTADIGRPEKIPAMNEFLKLAPGASVAEIQQAIAKLPSETREALLRHEKGGLLERMISLDPSREYADGEIFGGPMATASSGRLAPAADRPSASAVGGGGATSAGAKPAKPHGTSSVAYRDRDAGWSEVAEAPRVPAAAAPPPLDWNLIRGAADGAQAPRDAIATTSTATMPTATTPAATTRTATTTAFVPSSPSELADFDGHRSFTFVRLPVDCARPIEVQNGFDMGEGDVLLPLLAPFFRSEACLDQATVEATSAARYEEMRAHAAGGSDQPAGPMPPSAEMERQAKLGVCEAWPLAAGSAKNGWETVKLYIDEVGALRKLPRNPRAEALAEAVGQAVSIYGDAYVGRCRLHGKYREREENVDFGAAELASNAAWVLRERGQRASRPDIEDLEAQKAQAAQSKAEPPMASGADELGRYTWTQTAEDLEVRVRSVVPDGPRSAAKKAIQVSYGGGQSLTIDVKGATLLRIKTLASRVSNDDCSWTIDGRDLVLSMEKLEHRPWMDLSCPGTEVVGPVPSKRAGVSEM